MQLKIRSRTIIIYQLEVGNMAKISYHDSFQVLSFCKLLHITAKCPYFIPILKIKKIK